MSFQSFDRRKFLQTALAGAAAFSLAPSSANAQAPQKEVRIGYQKSGILVIARQQAAFEKALGPQGVGVKWVEFSSGPPMMEAMNAGSVDFGAVGDSPPIFAQAGGAAIVYVAGQPITNGQGILVPHNSPIRAIADLKGKRVAFAKGTSAHNVTLFVLEKAGLTYADITPVYLSPPDAGPAFANGTVDAWAIWDPYFAIGEKKQNARILINAHEVAKTNSFFIANRTFAQRNGNTVRDLVRSLAEVAIWSENNRDKVAASLAEVTGVEYAIQKHAADRASFAIGPVTEDIVVTQQAVADRFFALGLIPRKIAIREAVWSAPQT